MCENNGKRPKRGNRKTPNNNLHTMKIEIVTTRYRDNRNPFPGRITGIVKRPYKDRSHVLFRQMVDRNRLEREILLRQLDAEELERLADMAQGGQND